MRPNVAAASPSEAPSTDSPSKARRRRRSGPRGRSPSEVAHRAWREGSASPPAPTHRQSNHSRTAAPDDPPPLDVPAFTSGTSPRLRCHTRNVWPAPSARVFSSGSEQSASTYPVSGCVPRPRWRSAQPDPHNHSGLEGRSLFQVFKLPFDCQAIFLPPLADFSDPSAL